MTRHYVKIAFRSMQKQKLYASINIIGFAIGIAACLLISLYIYHETSYDRDNPHGDQVVRVVGRIQREGVDLSGIGFQAPMARTLLADFPEVEKAGRLMSNSLFGGTTNQVRRPDQTTNNYEEGFCFADSTIPEILDIKMVYGSRKQALAEPYSILLSKSLADKYFPGENPIGRPMVFNENPRLPIKVGGVMADLPSNSHLQYKAFISLAGLSFGDGEQQSWTQSNYGIYLQLRKGTDLAALGKKVTDDVLENYILPAFRAKGRSIAGWKGAHLILQPLADIHLHSYDIQDDPIHHGDIRFIWFFAGIAVFTLLLACINFLNLSTARSANRAKEVGLRKVIGSTRSNLIRQFLTESLLYSCLACCAALALALLALPLFRQMAGVRLSIPWSAWWLAPVFLLFILVIGLLAGIYPAFYLSWFKPIEVLKGKLRMGSKHGRLRSGLVVFQFTVSLILLIGTTVVYRQMQYILHTRIGFDKDQIVMIQGADALRNQTMAFKTELLRLPAVQRASISDYLPVGGTKRNGNNFWKSGDHAVPGVVGQIWRVDEDYIPTLGMKLVAGRNFAKDMHTDSNAVIINQAMADQLGYKEPLGKNLNNGENRIIIGVVENFNFEDIKHKVQPLCMVPGISNSIVSVKVKGADMQRTLASIDEAWKHFVPAQAMRYTFLDENYASMYVDVQRMQYLFTGFALLAVIIACLGLFALAAFMAEQRRKEISIRKVLGAPVSNLFGLLTMNFMKLILLSFVVATPISWWLMHKWLQDYANRVSLSWDVFALSGGTVLLIALGTICWQAVRASLANPVETLRAE